jgi:phospholipid transport system substrate-binding protein
MTTSTTTSTKSKLASGPATGTTRRRWLLGLGALPLLATGLATGLPGLAFAPSAMAETGAEAFIDAIGAQVLDILEQTDLSAAQKLEQLKNLLDANTDLDLVARLVLGRHWRSASEQQRKDYLALFRQILTNTLADRLNDYNGQTFELAGSAALSERDTAVQTRIIRVGGAPPLSVDWRVRETEGDFAIIDVVAEGVSLVVSQRNEVASIIERRGLDGLIETMRERSGEGETVL